MQQAKEMNTEADLVTFNYLLQQIKQASNALSKEQKLEKLYSTTLSKLADDQQTLATVVLKSKHDDCRKIKQNISIL